MCMGGFEKVVWKACSLFRRPFQLKVLDRHKVKTFGHLQNLTATTPKPIRCWKSHPNPKGSPKPSPNWFITNSTISAHRLPHTMQKAKPYGRPNTKHGAESVTKPFQKASKSTFCSVSWWKEQAALQPFCYYNQKNAGWNWKKPGI